MKIKTLIIIPTLILFAFFIGRCTAPRHPHSENVSTSEPAKPTVWTCSMHPQIQLPEFGKCPICFMDLIPLDSGSQPENERELHISPAAAKRIELETAPVERRSIQAEIRMTGKVDYDETRISTIASWVPGRIDRLFVDYTGISVKKGEHLAEIYSPELLTAQEELLQAIRTFDQLKNSQNTSLLETADATITAAREKLRLWGFTPGQIQSIEERGTPGDHMTIYSPASGIVIHKNAQEGLYVQTGTQIYTIADLSTVWIQLDAYESDLNALVYGGEITFTTEAYPGETFSGTITFIDPVISSVTRTAKVRVIVENPRQRLKPGMFVRATARPEITANGTPLNPDLSDKWICPMHPEIIKDQSGSCDVCDMPLVTAGSLGYADPASGEKPLVIPATAVLKTGKRAVVYVEKPDPEHPSYEGREITIGTRAGDFYIVKSGLDEGERVVTRGNFKLDAELQIQARPGMMSIPGETAKKVLQPQTKCPVMGGAINKEVFTDYNGLRIYFCCPGCDTPFLEDPEKYIQQMRDSGVEPEKIKEPAHE